MSLILDDAQQDKKNEVSLSDINRQLQVIIMILNEAYNTEFTIEDIEEEL